MSYGFHPGSEWSLSNKKLEPFVAKDFTKGRAVNSPSVVRNFNSKELDFSGCKTRRRKFKLKIPA